MSGKITKRGTSCDFLKQHSALFDRHELSEHICPMRTVTEVGDFSFNNILHFLTCRCPLRLLNQRFRSRPYGWNAFKMVPEASVFGRCGFREVTPRCVFKTTVEFFYSTKIILLCKYTKGRYYV